MTMFEMLKGTSLEEALKQFQAADERRGGKCMWMNYIGKLAMEGDLEAENFLCQQLLLDQNKFLIKTAFSFLTEAIKTPQPQTTATINAFRENPKNKGLVKETEEYLRKNKKSE